MALIPLLVAIIIAAILLYCTRLLLRAFAVTNPLATVIYVVVILICLVIILQMAGVNTGLRLS